MNKQELATVLAALMKVEEALEIVLELARENALDPDGPWTLEEQELREEAEKQQAALASVEDFFTNVIQEGRHAPEVTIHMEGGEFHHAETTQKISVVVREEEGTEIFRQIIYPEAEG